MERQGIGHCGSHFPILGARSLRKQPRRHCVSEVNTGEGRIGPTTMHFRPAHSEDAEQVAFLLNSTRHYPHLSPSDFRESLARDYSHLDRQMWMLEASDARQAHLQYFRHPYAGYMAWIACDPAHDAELIEAGLSFLDEMLQSGSPIAVVVADKVPLLAQRLELRGFTRASEEICLTLELARFQPSDEPVEALRRQGFDFQTVDQLNGDFSSIYELELESAADVPNLSVQRQPSFDEFCQTVRSQSEHCPYWVVALKEGTVVALAQHLRRSDGFFYSSGLGVRRAWRRRGLGLATKLVALERLKGAGGVRVDTCNDAANLPMLRLNQSLGYELLGRQARYSRP